MNIKRACHILCCVIFGSVGYVRSIIGVQHTPRDAPMNCLAPPMEVRERTADVIFTAKVLNLFQMVQVDGLYSGEVQVKRVYKGDNIVMQMKTLKRDARAFRNYNKVLRVTGLGDPSICDSGVREKDTKIFFLKTDTETGDLRLSAPIIHMSSYTLKKVDAAVKREYAFYCCLFDFRFVVLRGYICRIQKEICLLIHVHIQLN